METTSPNTVDPGAAARLPLVGARSPAGMSYDIALIRAAGINKRAVTMRAQVAGGRRY